MGTLEPHTSTVFTTVQLPIEYDPVATCPAFDHYLHTTFEPDDIPLMGNFGLVLGSGSPL